MGTAAGGYFKAIQLPDQVVEIGGYEVHHIQRYRLASREGRTLSDRFFQLFGVAVAFLGYAADKSGRIVGNLVCQGFAYVLTRSGYGSGGTDIGAGGHHSHIGGCGQECARRACLGATRGNIRNDGYVGLQLHFYHFPRGAQQATRCIKADNQQGCVGISGLLQGAFEVSFLDRVNRALNFHYQRPRGWGLGKRRPRYPKKDEGESDGKDKDPERTRSTRAVCTVCR